MQIRNASILITGANRGIGLGLARSLAKRGAHLHLQMRKENSEIAKELKAAGAASVTTWIADLGSRKNVEDLLLSLKDQSIDILVNNAGLLTGGLLESQSLDEIYSLMQVNVCSVIHLSRGLLPGMIARGRGKIINNSSVSAIMHFPMASTYAASKAAILTFSDCLQSELQGTGVTTLCLITPGVKTRMFDEIEVKYGDKMKVPKGFISTDVYGNQICEAIEDDRVWLEPKGSTAFGLSIARHFPALFRRLSTGSFHR
jgi:short-subunit dehydrogenase